MTSFEEWLDRNSAICGSSWRIYVEEQASLGMLNDPDFVIDLMSSAWDARYYTLRVGDL